jgi:hypothetical protein
MGNYGSDPNGVLMTVPKSLSKPPSCKAMLLPRRTNYYDTRTYA